MQSNTQSSQPLKVIIAGGGVAGLRAPSRCTSWPETAWPSR